MMSSGKTQLIQYVHKENKEVNREQINREYKKVYFFVFLTILSVTSFSYCIGLISSANISASILIQKQDPPKIVNFYEDIKIVQKRRENITKTDPNMAWLLSFPNSGTSYTLAAIKVLSGTAVASNYVNDHKKPVCKSNLYCPYIISKEKYPMPPDESYIITKTHCGGYAVNKFQLLSPKEFIQNCAQVRMKKGLKKVNLNYNPRLIGKAIHLLRDPFSNVISRFHLETHKSSHKNNPKWVKKYSNNRGGFRRWCRSYDKKFSSRIKHSIEFRFLKDLNYEEVLCFTEFFKYIHWHNNAFHTTKLLNIPTFILHYEEFDKNTNTTENNILDFLGLEKAHDGKEFRMSHYDGYFSDKEKKKIVDFIVAIASPRTLEEINSYYLENA